MRIFNARSVLAGALVAALALGLVGCGKSEDKSGGAAPGGGAAKGGGAVTRHATYTLSDAPGGLKLTLDVPAAWKEELDGTGAPTFTIPGRDFGIGPAIVLSTPSGDTPADRMQKVIRMQYDEADQAAAKREDLAGGRVWMAHTRADGYVHARMFVPAPGDAGIVMCLAIFKPEEAANLPALRALCDSVAFGS